MNLKLAAARVEELVVGAGPIPWTILAVLAALYGLLEFFFGVSQAPKEPLLAKSSIPYIGHTVSLLRHKMKYYEQLRYVDDVWSSRRYCIFSERKGQRPDSPSHLHPLDDGRQGIRRQPAGARAGRVPQQ